ncbi:hypothetical protein AND_003292 [Anopheles darlingi]|uniref:Uncharacterized protein n=1 Tax=Anopheles darlingi TaxID=43151 RepID=W5JQ00_ANODA|nr:hypothetical protein AND_003292 [Anopheles darlingi]
MDTTTIESGKQATLEDLIEWRHITDHWVKRSCSTETNDAICPSWFYLEFCKLCRQTILIKESSLAEFLQSHFPDFELVLSADGNVLLMDSVYVCSLLLYFSCVRYPVAYLRNVCKQFDESQQQRIKTFFKHFLTGRKINRGFLDSAVFNAVRSTPIAKQTPKWDDGLATPDSPHELHYKNKNLDQQLKTALAENASLEKQNEQLQRELHDLNEKNKRLVLRLEVLEEAGSDRNGKETLLEVTDFNTVYLRKQLIEKDEQLERLEAEMLHKDSKDALEHSYKEKLVQLEVRCAQLQEQLAEKNERDLAIRKENQILLSKVKTLEENKLERYGRFLLPAPAQACLRDNLRMEDEEGELFNATYLADLQVGRCWSPGADTVRYSELLQRNSMVPPHLRTNYGTMYPDCDVVASDTPDSISEGFDDSSTGLITRRKVSGTTSYKRPGPPTPSKKAGRVSFGGILPISNNQVQYKEALKNRNANSARSSSATTTSHNHSDPLINDAKTAGRTKTPGKFKQMLSSSNLLGNFNQRNEVTKKNFFPYYI